MNTIVIKDDYTPYRLKGDTVMLYTIVLQNDEFFVCNVCVFYVGEKDSLVSNIIRSQYTLDKMDAVRNNYDLVRDDSAGDKTEEYTKEYLDMQAWRKKAKELADEIMKEYNKEK